MNKVTKGFKQKEVLFLPNKDAEYFKQQMDVEVCIGYANGAPIMLREQEESPAFLGFSHGEEVWVE